MLFKERCSHAMSVQVFVCLLACLPVRLSVPACLSVCLSVRPSVCMCVLCVRAFHAEKQYIYIYIYIYIYVEGSFTYNVTSRLLFLTLYTLNPKL